MLRLLVTFVHVSAAMGVFGATAIEGASLLELNRAGTSPTAPGGFGLAQRAGSISFTLLLLSGIYLTQAVWGWRTAWVDVALLGLVGMGAIDASVTRRAMERLRVASDVGREYNVLVWSFLTRLGILIGIVFLMTVKPPLQPSLIAVAAAAGVGFLAGRPARRRHETRMV